MTYTFSTGSGFLNSPPRVVLIGNDNRPGSYPVDISPAVAAASEQHTKPYRDNIFPDTRIPYAQAHVIFTAVPNESESITLTNAQGQAHTFTFKLTSPNFATGPTSYDVSYDELSSTPREGDEGLTRSQIVTKRALEKFVEAVNHATGSLITASPTSYYGRAILTQRIPGTAGNTANSTTSADVTIQSFTGGNAGEIRYPFGIIASGSGEVLRRVLSTAESGTLDVPAAGNASLLTAYSDGHPYAVFQPYDESNSQQAFGIATGGSSLYGTQASLYSEFFTRGSTLGNLDESLSTKDKITIDLNPVSATTLQYQNVVGQNYPMAYWNFEKRVWEKIGFGTRPQSSANLVTELQTYMLGFGQGWENVISTASLVSFSSSDPTILAEFDSSKSIFRETGWNSCTDTFGFPSHAKFHATSSQYLDASTLIDRPFLVEKFVYEFSGSSSGQSEIEAIGASSVFRSGGGTFFILNQRKSNPIGSDEEYTKINVAVSSSGGTANAFLPPYSSSINSKQLAYGIGPIPTVTNVSLGGPSLFIDDVRDLVTYSRVGSIFEGYSDYVEESLVKNTSHPANFMDLAIEVPYGQSLGGKYTLASDIKTPCYSPSNSIFETWTIDLDKSRTGTSPSTNKNAVYLSKESNTRNSIDTPTGRSINGEFASSKLEYSAQAYPVISTATPPSRQKVFGIEKDSINSPYLILPSDKLIFGWQSILSYGYNAAGPSLTLKPGAGKLILYGSYLQDDKPVHDIYKDQLNSDAAHETLPAGPWVLDRFETEPQMMYSSSMREEHITGTMVTRNATGGLTVTDVNDFSTGGVRSVSARVSNGNVRQRWSFFRNNRLLDEEEQYYDSMQPNPVDMLFYGNTRAILYPLTNTTIVPLMVPGEVYKAAFAAEWPDPPGINLWYASNFPQWCAAINTYSNRNIWDGSFPFEAKYSSFRRVKKIGTKILAGETRRYFTAPQTYYGAGISKTIAGTAPNMKLIDPSANFGPGHVGQNIAIVSAGNPANVGTFTITSVTSTEVFYTNPSGLAEIGAAAYRVPVVEIPGTIQLGERLVNGGLMFFTGSLNGPGAPSVLYSPGGLFKNSVPEPYGGIIPTSDYQALFPFTRSDVDTNPVAPNNLVGVADGNNEGINYEWSRFMGCFGSGYRQMIQYGNITYAFPPSLYPNSLVYGSQYRGTKHGLINPTPLFSNAVFNGTRYGQLRDMMEQRQYTRFSLNDNTLTQAVVSVQFINRSAAPGTLNITSGSATNSSNISKFATSEHPYDDALVDFEQIWDRDTPLPETLIAL